MSSSHCKKKIKNQAKREQKRVHSVQAVINPAAHLKKQPKVLQRWILGLDGWRSAMPFGATVTLVIKKEMRLGDNAALLFKIGAHA